MKIADPKAAAAAPMSCGIVARPRAASSARRARRSANAARRPATSAEQDPARTPGALAGQSVRKRRRPHGRSSSPASTSTTASRSSLPTTPAVPRPPRRAGAWPTTRRATAAMRRIGRDLAGESVSPSSGLISAAHRQHLRARHVAGELGDVGVAGRSHQILGRADLDDHAVLHDGDAVGEPDRLVEIVGDEDDGLVEQPCRRRNSSCISRRISGSSAENGSSRNHSSGSTASERAMPTRCCWPPESSRGIVGLAAREADQLDHLAGARLALRARRRPAPPAGRRRCRARSDAAAARSAGTPCPSCAGGSRSSRASDAASRSRPSNSTSPAVGSTSRDRQRTSVDLPEPDSPMMTKISPSRTSRSTSRTAVITPGAGELVRRRRPIAAARKSLARRGRRASRRRGRRA